MSGPTTATRLLVINRDAFVCQYCGSPIRPAGTYSLQHRCPRGMGGSRTPWIDLPSNLVVLHGTGTTGCHGVLEAERDRAVRLGFLIRHGRVTAAEVPIKVPHPFGGFEWVLLDDDGGREWLSPQDAGAAMRRLGVWPDEGAVPDAGR